MTQPVPTPEPATPRLVTVSQVKWHNILEFTQLFRGFRLAINPAKILLALLALLMIYSAGRLFDLAWGPQVDSHEISDYQTMPPRIYSASRDFRLKNRTVALQSLISQAPTQKESLEYDQIRELAKHPSDAYAYLKKAYLQQFYVEVDAHALKRVQMEKEWPNNPFATPNSRTPAQIEQDDRDSSATNLLRRITEVKETLGSGIFDSFLKHEIHQFDSLVQNTLSFLRVTSAQPLHSENQIPGESLSTSLLTRDTTSLARSDTIVGCLYNMAITGPMWLVSGTAPMQWKPEHPETWGGWFKMTAWRALYLASLFLLVAFSILLLAFTGGVISRLSAMELAGNERAPLADVITFTIRRLWSFIKAPITPFLIILVVGLFITAVALLGSIPFVGEIILGIFFVGLLVIGFVIMLLVLGILGGINLLYPTIAVEGADAFDAMSRAFAYVYARPWRLLFYSLSSLIYGVITYIFVSFAVYLVLLITHTFAGWGANFFGNAHGRYSGLPKLETLWPTPQLDNLIAPTNWYAMNGTEYLGALFLHFWVYLFIVSLGAYVISYYFSSNTILYLLLRRSVDGQATTDVFLEEPATPPAPAEPAKTEPVA